MVAAPPVVLASNSAYRRALLARLLPAFECLSPDLDERPRADERPVDTAARLALAKARACAGRRPDAVVIGSDQTPALGNDILHKPGTHERAIAQLRRCSGKAVVFHTAVAIVGPGDAPADTHCDETIVRFRNLDDAGIERYLALDTPYDCAGSFKVESHGITLFESIESRDPTALQGLPLIWVARRLRARGIMPG